MAPKNYILLGLFMSLGLIAFVSAEVVPITQCNGDDSSEESNDSSSSNSSPPSNCTVTELRVTPCPEAASGTPCKVKRGTTIKLAFDYLPQYPAEKLSGRAYWANALMDLPLVGMDTNACNYTACPVQANQKNTYSYDLLIADYFPIRAYDVKWKVWSDNMECCYLTKIKLTK